MKLNTGDHEVEGGGDECSGLDTTYRVPLIACSRLLSTRSDIFWAETCSHDGGRGDCSGGWDGQEHGIRSVFCRDCCPSLALLAKKNDATKRPKRKKKTSRHFGIDDFLILLPFRCFRKVLSLPLLLLVLMLVLVLQLFAASSIQVATKSLGRSSIVEKKSREPNHSLSLLWPAVRIVSGPYYQVPSTLRKQRKFIQDTYQNYLALLFYL